MAFIELTNGYGNIIQVNMEHVAYIESGRYGSILVLINKEEIPVKESLKEILKKIL